MEIFLSGRQRRVPINTLTPRLRISVAIEQNTVVFIGESRFQLYASDVTQTSFRMYSPTAHRANHWPRDVGKDKLKLSFTFDDCGKKVFNSGTCIQNFVLLTFLQQQGEKIYSCRIIPSTLGPCYQTCSPRFSTTSLNGKSAKTTRDVLVIIGQRFTSLVDLATTLVAFQ